MTIIHWQLIVKEPSQLKLKPYLQLDSRQQKPVKQKIIFQTMQIKHQEKFGGFSLEYDQ